MEKQILEILANAPDISEVGLAYIDYLRLEMFIRFGSLTFFILAVLFVIYHLFKDMR